MVWACAGQTGSPESDARVSTYFRLVDSDFDIEFVIKLICVAQSCELPPVIRLSDL